MKKLLTLMPLLFGAVACFGQAAVEIPGSFKSTHVKNTTVGAKTTLAFSNPHEGVKGSPFYFDSPQKAEIVIGGATYNDLEAMYNVYDNQVLYRNKQGNEFMLPADKVDKLVLTDPASNNTLSFVKFNAGKAGSAKLTPVLFDGSAIRLFIVPEITHRKADYTGAYNADRRYDEFVKKQDYYLVKNGGEPEKIKLNKKTLLQVVSDKSKQVETFIKEEQVNVSSEEGWVKVLTYYESL